MYFTALNQRAPKDIDEAMLQAYIFFKDFIGFSEDDINRSSYIEILQVHQQFLAFVACIIVRQCIYSVSHLFSISLGLLDQFSFILCYRFWVASKCIILLVIPTQIHLVWICLFSGLFCAIHPVPLNLSSTKKLQFTTAIISLRLLIKIKI